MRLERRGALAPGALSIWFVLAATAIAVAASVEALSDEELVARARVVVHADVARVHAEWDDKHARIYTVVELTPREVLKGERAATVTLRIPGGEKDGIATVVHGMPRFDEGEEVVVFVSGTHAATGTCVPVGLGQGKWRIERDASGERIARRSLAGAKLVTKDGKEPPPVATESKVDDLLARIRAEVKRQAEKTAAKESR